MARFVEAREPGYTKGRRSRTLAFLRSIATCGNDFEAHHPSQNLTISLWRARAICLVAIPAPRSGPSRPKVSVVSVSRSAWVNGCFVRSGSCQSRSQKGTLFETMCAFIDRSWHLSIASSTLSCMVGHVPRALTSWETRLLIVVAFLGARSVLAQDVAKLPAAPAPEVIAAWDKAGAEFGWIVLDPWGRQSWTLGIGMPLDASGPFFEVETYSTGRLKSLPPPNVPFGLRLSGRQVTDAAIGELAAFDQLRVLELYETLNVTGAGLMKLALFTQLRSLDLLYVGGGAGLPSNVVPTDLKGLTHLQSLSIAVTEDSNRLSLPQGLRSLHLAGEITDARLAELSSLSQLRALTLSSNRLGSSGLKNLSGHEHLEALSLRNPRLRINGATELAALKQLRRLRMQVNSMSDAGLKDLARLTQLRSLDLSFFNPDGSDLALNELAALTELRWLGLTGPRVSDEGLKDLGRLNHLHTLLIFNARVTDAGLKGIASLNSLRRLQLASTQVTDAGLKDMARLTQLQSLNLSESQVTDAGLNELVALKQLRSLDVYRTRVTEAGARALQDALPKLQVSGYRPPVGR
jgi:internalin A